MMSYNTKVYMEQGGDTQVVDDGGEIRVNSGGKITGGGTQASAIADITVSGVYTDDDDAIETAINSILAALRGVGIIAES